MNRSQRHNWNFLFLSRCLASCLLGLRAWRASPCETRGRPEYGYLSTVNHSECQQDMQTGKWDTVQIKKPNITLRVFTERSFVLPSRCTVTVFEPQKIHDQHQEWQLHVSLLLQRKNKPASTAFGLVSVGINWKHMVIQSIFLSIFLYDFRQCMWIWLRHKETWNLNKFFEKENPSPTSVYILHGS